MDILISIDKKLQNLYAPDSNNVEEEGLQKRKSHFYSLLFCLLLHTFTFFLTKEYYREIYMLTATSIILCIVIIMTVARKSIFYLDVCTTFLLVTITPMLTFMSEKYLFFSIAGTWIIPSIIILMTQNYKLTLSSFVLLGLLMKFYYKSILINKISVSSVAQTIEYLESQIDLLCLTGFFYFLSVLNFNSILGSKKKVLLKTQAGLKTSLQQQEAFMHSFSHELRNPMNTMLGNLELATQEVKEKNVLKIIKTAQVCGDILLQMVNNILDTAKADIGKLEVSLIPTNLRETLEKVWTVCSENIKRKRLKGYLTICKDIPYNLMLDPQRVTQALLNLISNSTKFTDEGVIKVKAFWLGNKRVDDDCFDPIPYSDEGVYEKDDILQAFLGRYLLKRDQSTNIYDTLDLDKQRFGDNSLDSPRNHNSGVLKIVVTDTGCGMTQAEMSKLFQRFSQVHSDPNKRKIGTGLGLWITKQICEKMNGEIRVYSEKGKGTTFIMCVYCEIPCSRGNREANENSEGQLLRQDISMEQENRSLKALIVDDNPANILINRKFAARAGVDVLKVLSTGQAAIDEYIKQVERGVVIDLVIMDLDVMSQDIKDACKRIREFEERSGKRKCSILVIGAHTQGNEMQSFASSESDARANYYFYRKPLFYKDLKNLIIGIRNLKFRGRRNNLQVFNQIEMTTEQEEEPETI